MDLFHFTTVDGLKGIYVSREIFLGGLPPFKDKGGKKIAISLTTCELPIGHGLPTGQILSLNELEYLKKYAPDNFALEDRGNNQYATIDHTQIRLRLSDEKLKPFGLRKAIDYHANAAMLERMCITGYLPNSAWDSLNFNKIKQGFKSGKLTRKDHTWWLVFSPIPIEIIETVAIKVKGNYLESSLSAAEKILAEEI